MSMKNEDNMTHYIPRIFDKNLERNLRIFGCTYIVGPKGCGKTTTGKQFAKTVIEFEDPVMGPVYKNIAENNVWDLFSGDTPILFDEWQDAKDKIWLGVRKKVDDLNEKGLYILTGSASRRLTLSHTGTGRISRLTMLPMSLYESGESSGEVSLMDLFDHPGKVINGSCSLSFDDIVFAVCRGGWPQSILLKNREDKLLVARDLTKQIYETDVENIEGKKINQNLAHNILLSYARNICTCVRKATLCNDAAVNETLDVRTFDKYVDDLERLYVVEEIHAWCPNIRSKTSFRTTTKKNFIDPSIAVAALNLTPESCKLNMGLFGFLFESLCIRDIKIYSSSHDGVVSFYHDINGLEADIILHLNDGRYALMECKLAEKDEEVAAKHLNTLEQSIVEHDANCEREVDKYGKPAFKAILTATQHAYQRPDGVYIIPIGCLKD